MLIARILYPVVALGPGKRIAIWTCGCKRRCSQCANPELQEFDSSKEISVETLADIIRSIAVEHEVNGLTFTGGEPFEQADELAHLLKMVRPVVNDILVFSGYTLDQLRAKGDHDTDLVLANIDALVDGEYIDEQNNGSTLRGSDNQVFHLFSGELRKRYEDYMLEGRKFQNFETHDGVIAVGLHYRGFMKELQERMERKLGPVD